MMKSLIGMMALLALMAAASGQAQVARCVERGEVTYSDRGCATTARPTRLQPEQPFEIKADERFGAAPKKPRPLARSKPAVAPSESTTR
ncbi:MAG TPA: DUF4124 domain-containing protein [Ramlibacter sp.]|nr:DUF4124 domain-containing protein [Ramlibacter sp.]